MYVQCDAGNVVNVRFKDEMREMGILQIMCRLHMTKMLHMIKKFELLKNLNKKLILVKNIYLAKFLRLTWISGYGYDMNELGLDYI